MNTRPRTVRGIFSCFTSRLGGAAPAQPLHLELFSAEQREQHARTLAGLHRVAGGPPRERLLGRLAENEKLLLDVYKVLIEDVTLEQRITPAGEWLLDNFYVLEEQINTARRHLPKGYSRQLPHLSSGPSAGLPRVYDIALETIAHCDGRVNGENLGSVVSAYQAVTVLQLGELWAIPIMLRLALIENLRRVAALIAIHRRERESAAYWADKMVLVAAKEPEKLIVTIADMARSNPPLVSSFVAELTRRLRGLGPALALPLTWVEQRLLESGLSIEELVRTENQLQAANQVSMSNCIGSLRALNALDWPEFVESMSGVEKILRADPGGVYAQMDFSTRDLYRHVVEHSARNSPFSESEIAATALRLAQEGAAANGRDHRAAHVGFYLVDQGLAQLEKLVVLRVSAPVVFCRACRAGAVPLYCGAITLLTMLLAGGMVFKAYSDAVQGWVLWLTGALALLAASQLAVSLTNWLTTLLVKPRTLPRMDFSKGIPHDCQTLVIVPAMLSSTQGIEDLVKDLEVRFLANQQTHLHFGLLTDFCDAEAETLPQDQALLQLIRTKIIQLNTKYGHGEGNAGASEGRGGFFLFHRPRRWNARDKVWMGYERKRGKLEELNGFLRGESQGRFSVVLGNAALLPAVRYVITLDSDTQLARDSAWHFVAAMAHPLNRARYDAGKQRVTGGYGILQPRVAASLSGTNRSRYARMCSSETGIDPYTRASSDVYQDLFGEGSFTGKGIYDVDAFRQTLSAVLPDNRILSHDLLEGGYARSGLLSDVWLYEEYPLRYDADMARRHRWIRGDWQIASWMLPGVPGQNGQARKNPLSLLSRWKIFDNLRRSLTAAALVLLLFVGWGALPSPWFWTLAVSGIVLIPSFIASAVSALHKAADMTLGQHLGAAARLAPKQCAHAMFSFVCLPYEAFLSLDAIVRTLWRLCVSHKNLLQWSRSEDTACVGGTGLWHSLRRMWIGPLSASAAVGGLMFYAPEALPVAAPVLLLWFFSPALAWWCSRPLGHRIEALSADQNVFLRKLARKTWAFFDHFVGPEDNWLPPDNYQEYPVARTAHRTSPTNMGLSLLANLTAYDFGAISAGRCIERSSQALDVMERLERYRGHFFNWYDTQSLKPLLPLYVSSVDSGNLAGHLLTLQAGIREIPERSIQHPVLFAGLDDTFAIITEAAARESYASSSPQLAELQLLMESVTRTPPVTLMESHMCLERLAAAATAALADMPSVLDSVVNEYQWWVQAFIRQCDDARDELGLLAPWVTVLSAQHMLEEFPELNKNMTLRQLGRLESDFAQRAGRGGQKSPAAGGWHDELLRCVKAGSGQGRARMRALDEIDRQCTLFSHIDYDFLYDSTRRLLHIGYNVDERRADSGYYDLLASEARLAAFVGIAQGELPQESWFALGRLLTFADGEPILLSWSGSMFEYLMPLLVMPVFEGTLLDETCKAAVACQIGYGKKRAVPWGISESGYSIFDAHRDYQYRAFGVPGLGLKRGLAEDLVIAPYASALALMVRPQEACQNLQKLAAEGFETRYGFYEAVDYTTSRLPRGQSRIVVRSFMAHHQGMSLLSIASLLLDRPMQKRFASIPMFQATMLLLQERIPHAVASYAHARYPDLHIAANVQEASVRIFDNPAATHSEVQLLSNGRYHVMLTSAGGGYSRWQDLAVTRWREDSTCDNWGSFCYIRDLDGGEFWSTTHQPVCRAAASCKTVFSEGRVEFQRRDNEYDSYTEIVVSPEDDIELRRVRVTNRGQTRRHIDITSYAEVVLAPPAADALHPAFSNLFVQTEIVPEEQAIVCTRRPRAEGEHAPWMLHTMAVHGGTLTGTSYESDRRVFVGRERSPANPQAMDMACQTLSGRQGSVLDPIVAIRSRVRLEAGQSVTVDIVSGIGGSREDVIALARKYHDRYIADRVFDMAWTHGQVLLRQLNASEADAQLYGRLAGAVVYASAGLRAEAATLVKNRRGQSGLWGYGISGDLPIVLVQIEDPANIELVHHLLQAHAYWRLKGLAVDLVIWNEDQAGYRQILHDQITTLIASGSEATVTDQPGGVFVRPADRIAEEDRILFQTVARAILTDSRGTLAAQIGGHAPAEPVLPALVPTRKHRPGPLAAAPLPRADLLFYNGLGGFTADGREYVITTAPGLPTPAPWVNVLANPEFGTVVSETGLAYTWSENAHEFRLTPWSNDPVSDSQGEAIYLRDEESGHVWSPAPMPCRGAGHYVTRHGFGYSVFEHTEMGIYSELRVYVALDAAVKFSVLSVRNLSGRTRRLSATGYVSWVLGDLPAKSGMHILTELDAASGALFACNPYNTEFPDRTAFFDVDDTPRSISADRMEFLGRNGKLGSPAAMKRMHLSGRVGAALDPCGAIQVPFDLAAGEERELCFRLGVGKNKADARELARRFQGPTAARSALDTVWQYWAHTLGAISVETPDPSFTMLANGWLVYQVLACRLWARSAGYQSGGAFGFRDQLQDVMALIHATPELVREHLLRAAAHQFPEGDAQHWWHPPLDRGVRTRCSDDYLWLPFASCHYVRATGDTGVLDEPVGFVEGRPLKAEEDSYYDLPGRSEVRVSLYEHCTRALVHGLRFGSHGLPLMGSGDWNDGMDLVGGQGKGESVWLGFFLYQVLVEFAELARMRDDTVFARRCDVEAQRLRRNIEQHGWDGGWYRRAYFDDGTPLGSAQNQECQIDSIAQSWSVLSGAGDAERSRLGMDALSERLVRREARLVQLFDPPFDNSELNPGYIKGYVPGVRENGGQYTHAAVWAAMAFAHMGDTARAWELFTLINPINHAASASDAAVYMVEPYVLAADVYAVPPHTGRGGWSWYTGSAAWMYRLMTESLLGLRRENAVLHVTPCLPPEWAGCTVHYRYHETVYHIEMQQWTGDKDAQRLGDKEAQRPGDEDAQRPGDEDAQRLGDKDAQRPGDKDAQRLGDKDAQQLGDKDVQRPGDEDVQRLGDKDAQRPGDKDVQRPGDKGTHLTVDGVVQPCNCIQLVNDGAEHRVSVRVWA